MKKKSLLLVLALVLVVSTVVGTTLAWLQDTTGEVKNTFTTSGIDISLTETPNAKSDPNKTENDIWKAAMIPGYKYAKDPKVTVEDATTEEIYLFVKFEVTNPNQYVTYTSTLTAANGWTQGTGTGTGGNGVPTNVWYRTVKPTDATKEWYLLQGEGTDNLKNGYVAISGNLTKDNMPAASATPELVYTAYACQYMKNNTENFTPAEAWEILNPTT